MSRFDPTSYTLTLGEHLEELRGRLLTSLIVVFGLMLVLFLVFDEQVLQLCLWPKDAYNVVLQRPPQIPDLMTIGALDRFKYTILVSIVFGAVLGSPVIAYQFWAFVKTGLYPTERAAVTAYLPLSVLLFLAGFAFGYFILLPTSLDFLLNFGMGDLAIKTELTMSSYFTYFFLFTFIMALVFQIPVVIMGLARVGIVTPAFLRKYRRHFIVLALVVGMLLTPPDPITQIIFAGPMFVLYELGIWLSMRGARRHETAREARVSDTTPDGEPAPGPSAPNAARVAKAASATTTTKDAAPDRDAAKTPGPAAQFATAVQRPSPSAPASPALGPPQGAIAADATDQTPGAPASRAPDHLEPSAEVSAASHSAGAAPASAAPSDDVVRLFALDTRELAVPPTPAAIARHKNAAEPLPPPPPTEVPEAPDAPWAPLADDEHALDAVQLEALAGPLDRRFQQFSNTQRAALDFRLNALDATLRAHTIRAVDDALNTFIDDRLPILLAAEIEAVLEDRRARGLMSDPDPDAPE